MKSHQGSRSWHCLAAFLFLVLTFGCTAPESETDDDTEMLGEASSAHSCAQNEKDQLERAGGAFTCDFGLSPGNPAQIPALIERDRVYMAARKGMLRKQLPILLDPATGALSSGGRYLFETHADAVAYKSWLEHDYELDGTPFLDRPLFIAPDCHAWEVIRIHEAAPIPTSQYVLRTERWSVPNTNARNYLGSRWHALREEAEERGLTAVWLTYNSQEDLVQLVYFADRLAPSAPNTPDFASLEALQDEPALGDALAKPSWTKVFDRTQWVLSVWYPFKSGDHGPPSLWPNSPPFPQPSCGDAVCEVSRGESSGTCPADCPASCGNNICQGSENTLNCPGDCRI